MKRLTSKFSLFTSTISIFLWWQTHLHSFDLHRWYMSMPTCLQGCLDIMNLKAASSCLSTNLPKKKPGVVLESAKLSAISGGGLCYIARCKTWRLDHSNHMSLDCVSFTVRLFQNSTRFSQNGRKTSHKDHQSADSVSAPLSNSSCMIILNSQMQRCWRQW
jgi:hypothetical protein